MSSYPSGHAFRSVFVAIVLTYVVFQMKKLPLIAKVIISGGGFLFALLVCLGKVTLGMHWTTDIVGGAFYGAGMALLTLLLL